MELSETAGLTDPHFVAGEGSNRKRMKTIESDTYELSATDLEMLGSISADQPVQDPLADTRRDTEQSQPGVATVFTQVGETELTLSAMQVTLMIRWVWKANRSLT